MTEKGEKTKCFNWAKAWYLAAVDLCYWHHDGKGNSVLTDKPIYISFRLWGIGGCNLDETWTFLGSIFAKERLGFHFSFIFLSFSVSILRKMETKWNEKWCKNECEMNQKCHLWTTLMFKNTGLARGKTINSLWHLHCILTLSLQHFHGFLRGFYCNTGLYLSKKDSFFPLRLSSFKRFVSYLLPDQKSKKIIHNSRKWHWVRDFAQSTAIYNYYYFQSYVCIG